MADTPGGVPTYKEPITDPKGVTSRTWYRYLIGLGKLSGKLAQSIVVMPNSFFVSGTLNSGDSLEPNAIPGGTLLGNSSGSLAEATPQEIDTSLSLEGGLLGIAPIAAMSLFGNAGSVVAKPSEIVIGANLTILPTTPPTLAASGGGSGPPGTSDLTSAQVLSWWRG